MPKVTLVCKVCKATARRELSDEAGSRGIRETSSEPAYCPKGHGLMLREDGLPQEDWALWSPVAGANMKGYESRRIHIQQPEDSKLCGHSCVAMALGVSLAEAIKLIGHKKGVHNHEVVRALGSRADAKKFVLPKTIADPCIIRVKGSKHRHHLVLYQNQMVYDPAYSAPAPSFAEWEAFIKAIGWRVVSVLPLKLSTSTKYAETRTPHYGPKEI